MEKSICRKGLLKLMSIPFFWLIYTKLFLYVDNPNKPTNIFGYYFWSSFSYAFLWSQTPKQCQNLLVSMREIIIGTLVEFGTLKSAQSNSTMHCRLNRLNQTSKKTSETRCLCWKCSTVWIESCHSNDWPPRLRLILCSCHGVELSERMVFLGFTKAGLRY